MTDQEHQAPEPAAATTPSDDQAPAPDAEQHLGDPGKRALAAEREARRAAEDRAAELTDRVRSFEHADDVRDVSREYGLTDAQAATLRGSTRDELEAHAEQLRDAFTRRGPERRRDAFPGPPDGPDGLPPRNQLVSGAVPMVDAEPADNPAKVADRIMDHGP